MKSKILAALLVLFLAVWLLPLGLQAQGTEPSGKGAGDIISQAKEQLSAVFGHVGSQAAGEIFSFLKELVQDDALKSEEGMINAIKEGKEKFGVEVDREDAQKLVDTMERLEEIGFSPEYILDKAQGLYQQYGADFVDHMDEVVAGAAKDAAQGAVQGFFANLKESVKNFFSNIFS